MSDHFVTWASWFWSSLYVLWLCSRWDTASILESCINMLNCCVSLSFSLAVFFLNLFSPSPLCIPVRSDVSDRIPDWVFSIRRANQLLAYVGSALASCLKHGCPWFIDFYTNYKGPKRVFSISLCLGFACVVHFLFIFKNWHIMMAKEEPQVKFLQLIIFHKFPAWNRKQKQKSPA